jgi:Uma2 family endonuclease
VAPGRVSRSRLNALWRLVPDTGAVRRPGFVAATATGRQTLRWVRIQDRCYRVLDQARAQAGQGPCDGKPDPRVLPGRRPGEAGGSRDHAPRNGDHMTTVLLDQDVEIPPIGNLQEFRRWALSAQFPPRGRIDYIAGRVEVDMSPEDVFTHGTLKSELAARITDRVNELDLGHTLIANTRVSSVPADLSAEPDVVVITHQALDEQRVKLVPKASGEPDRYVEVEGGPDLVVEIVSDSSEQKDTRRLPNAYFRAGVRELWLLDARGAQMVFQIRRRGAESFLAAEPDAAGYQTSEVLAARYALERSRHTRGHWVYRLRMASR